MATKVEVIEARKSFGEQEVLHGVTFDAQPGEFVVLVGPSGCGKSTMLRMLAGLEEITAGDVLFGGERVNEQSPAERGVGMVFQSYALYPHMTVRENVAFPLRIAKQDEAAREARVDAVLDTLGLTDLAGQRPSQLSGGQRQRVAIGRAIVRNLKVFLFDEPLSNLDTALRVQMRLELAALHRRLKNTVVYVTHDQVEAMTLADKIVVMDAGRVRQIGPPLELYESPANLFVATFLGSPKMGLIPMQARPNGAGSTLSSDDGDFDVAATDIEGPVTLGVRPERVTLTEPGEGHVRGEIAAVERLGSDAFAFIDVPSVSDPVAVRLTNHPDVSEGEQVGLRLDPRFVHLFDADGDNIQSEDRKRS